MKSKQAWLWLTEIVSKLTSDHRSSLQSLHLSEGKNNICLHLHSLLQWLAVKILLPFRAPVKTLQPLLPRRLLKMQKLHCLTSHPSTVGNWFDGAWSVSETSGPPIRVFNQNREHYTAPSLGVDIGQQLSMRPVSMLQQTTKVLCMSQQWILSAVRWRIPTASCRSLVFKAQQ